MRVGAAVWDGAYVLSAWLDAQPPGTFSGLRCVELGCGLGLVGLVLARLGAAAVYLTDKPTPSALAGPRGNAARNKLLLAPTNAGAAAAGQPAAAAAEAAGLTTQGGGTDVVKEQLGAGCQQSHGFKQAGPQHEEAAAAVSGLAAAAVQQAVMKGAVVQHHQQPHSQQDQQQRQQQQLSPLLLQQQQLPQTCAHEPALAVQHNNPCTTAPPAKPPQPPLRPKQQQQQQRSQHAGAVGSRPVVQVCGLDWECPASLAAAAAAIRAEGPIDLIVASDCIYPGEPPRSLLHGKQVTASCLCNGRGSVAATWPSCAPLLVWVVMHASPAATHIGLGLQPSSW